MPTTFNAIYLGTVAALDPSEGNVSAENAASLVGTTFGSAGSPLMHETVSISPGTAGFGGNQSATGYDPNNSLGDDEFRVDGGPDQTFDTAVVYNATITYWDGTTAPISAVLFQDTSGNLYLAPEMTNNTDHAAMEAKPIESLTIDTVVNDAINLASDRAVANFAVCFASDTLISTPSGPRAATDLRVGDVVDTLDQGPKPVRWIGATTYDRHALIQQTRLKPVRVRKGTLGATQDLLVSAQHALLMPDMSFVRAKHLVELGHPGVRIAHGKRGVTYMHLLLDRHAILCANGVLSESFYPGPQALASLSPKAQDLLFEVRPTLKLARHVPACTEIFYGPTARPVRNRKELRGQPLQWLGHAQQRSQKKGPADAEPFLTNR